MASLETTNRHGYSVRFSPSNADILVAASSQYFGLCGAGTIHLLELSGDDVQEIGQAQWTDGLFDVAWCCGDEDLVATSSGDGSLQLWTELSLESGSPIARISAHSAEVYSIDWAKSLSARQILSASWDKTIKIWDSSNAKLVACFSGQHSDVIFSAQYSNCIPNTFSSVGADGSLMIWDSLTPKPVVKVAAHDGEVLTCSWNKFNSNVLATGASDGLIRGWDLRHMSSNFFELKGCEYAVRRIEFSPHLQHVLVSASYDFSTRFWDYELQVQPLESIVQHSEFVYGVDWNPNRAGQVADCGWDSIIHVFTPESLTSI